MTSGSKRLHDSGSAPRSFKMPSMSQVAPRADQCRDMMTEVVALCLLKLLIPDRLAGVVTHRCGV